MSDSVSIIAHFPCAEIKGMSTKQSAKHMTGVTSVHETSTWTFAFRAFWLSFFQNLTKPKPEPNVVTLSGNNH